MANKVGLTDAKIAGLKAPAAGQIELADGIVPGLRLRMGASGIKTYILRKRVQGKWLNVTIGRHGPSFTLAHARKKARDLLVDVEQGKSIARKPGAKRQGSKGVGTVAELYETYLSQQIEGKSVAYAGDLGDAANCAKAVATAIEAFGRLDVLCNVAGILRFHALADVTPDVWALLFSANVTAPFFMIQAAMPHLIETKGNIVNVVSTAAFLGQAYTAPYAATKAALLSLTKSLAMEFMHAPVRINALAPGGMLTEMVQTLEFPKDADQSLIARYIGIRPPSQPEDIVEPLLFLASERARSVHGACYGADSGITAG